jgi:hypothetical protein
MMLDRRDWVLLVVASPQGADVSPVQLQKALFLLSKKLSPEQLRTSEFYEFEPYDYGPFNAKVYDDALVLTLDGLISIDQADHQRYRVYRATPQGLKRADELRRALDPGVAKFLDETVAWVRSMSFQALVRAIYRLYPEMRANSVFEG